MIQIDEDDFYYVPCSHQLDEEIEAFQHRKKFHHAFSCQAPFTIITTFLTSVTIEYVFPTWSKLIVVSFQYHQKFLLK